MTITGHGGISFVIPCHNAGDYLVEAVESVVEQPLRRPYEVVIVDDGSDDDLTRKAIDICAGLPGVRVVRLEQRQGHHAARNAGLAAARLEYVMQVDADDRLATEPFLLAAGSYPDRAVEILESDPDTAFVHTMSWMFGAFEGFTISSYPCREDLVVRKHHVPTSIVCRRADALECGLYDPRVLKWGDWAFAVNLLASRFRRGAANNIHCVAGPFYEYRVHSRVDRVSDAEVSELDMTRLVVERNLDFFRDRLERNDSAPEIALDVMEQKPTRLDDLLYMAQFDLHQAQIVAQQREFSLASPYEALGIP
ncbi:MULTISPECIES: glycosyltransferase [Streptomyces]|uniref:glycosyltransferase family 2 protein n=1 Tax=Streptomyces TaxID=1883 RepID=UPI0015C4CC65|nr:MULTISPECIES: glycosyltransferase [Streptomyces]MDW4903447.1 glycosyltransferase [Streptomyces californicus]QLG33398.1 glycosyltransferase [Streptomyces sp. CB04723]